MAQIHETIDVEVPLWTAYDQWTQFELFPEFMDHVAQTEQLEDDLVRFTTTIGGVRRTFTARIQEQRPDRMIRWQDTDRPAHHGEIRFEPVGPDATRLDVSILWNPEDVVEAIGSFFKLDQVSVHQDLANFKKYIEERHQASGGWHGTIPSPNDGPPPEQPPLTDPPTV